MIHLSALATLYICQVDNSLITSLWSIPSLSCRICNPVRLGILNSPLHPDIETHRACMPMYPWHAYARSHSTCSASLRSSSTSPCAVQLANRKAAFRLQGNGEAWEIDVSQFLPLLFFRKTKMVSSSKKGSASELRSIPAKSFFASFVSWRVLGA
jgi:hypothetical protein